MLICRQKKKIHHPYFCEDIVKIWKLVYLDSLCKPGYARPKCQFELVKQFDVYLHVKINVTIPFFLKILLYKESCNLIGRQHFGPLLENPNFARYGTGGEISITAYVFIFDQFQEKLMTKFFSKNRGHFRHFLPKFGQK